MFNQIKSSFVNPLHFSVDIASVKSNIKIKTRKTRSIFKESKKENIPKENIITKQKNLKNIAEKYNQLYANLLPIYTFILWKKRLRRGIKILCAIRKHKIESAIFIQKFVKKFLQYQRYKKVLIKIKYIQRYWKHVRPIKNKFKKIKRLAVILSKYAKKQFSIKNKAAIFIQKTFKSFKTKKKYQSIIKTSVSKSRHLLLLKRQSMLVQERNRKKAAVRKIER